MFMIQVFVKAPNSKIEREVLHLSCEGNFTLSLFKIEALESKNVEELPFKVELIRRKFTMEIERRQSYCLNDDVYANYYLPIFYISIFLEFKEDLHLYSSLFKHYNDRSVATESPSTKEPVPPSAARATQWRHVARDRVGNVSTKWLF